MGNTSKYPAEIPASEKPRSGFKKITQMTMGVVDFEWDEIVQFNGEVASFKKINVIYGYNYSGKTTLSKAFRAIETSTLPEHYKKIKFSIEDYDSNTISESSIQTQSYPVRVFNADFVKDHLSFIIDEKSEINSFAVFGEKNKQIDIKIKNLEHQLGSVENDTGMQKEIRVLKQAYTDSKATLKKAEGGLESKRKAQATDIRYSPALFGDINYDRRKLISDIETVNNSTYAEIDDSQQDEYRKLLKDEKQEKVSPIPPIYLQLDTLAKQAESIVTRKITLSDPIQELLLNSSLENWVRSGITLHKERDKCGFCGQRLPNDIMEKIDKHFTKETNELINEIEPIVNKIAHEKNHVEHFFDDIRDNKFYSKYKNDVAILLLKFSNTSKHYINALTNLQEQVVARKDNISHALEFEYPQLDIESINEIYNAIKTLINDNNQYGDYLKDKQNKAMYSLRLHEVKKFIDDKSYFECIQNIAELSQNATDDERAYNKKISEIDEITKDINKLKSSSGDEAQAVKSINKLLTNYFGHQYLYFFADKNTDGKYKFEIMRDKEKAFNLSEGEKNLIAFCYFIAKLEDVNTKNIRTIIWIDDPVSSLDSNHIFFVSSIINMKIIGDHKYEQLFISTHNWDFIKYLKSSSPDDPRSGDREFFFISNNGKQSQINIMDESMINHGSEFGYSFQQIYKCAHDTEYNEEIFYNFGNNARKFLETFTDYLYLDGNPDARLKTFLGDNRLAHRVISRINNELSHGGLGRTMSHPSVNAQLMRTEALYILEKVKETNEIQFNTLENSVTGAK